MRCFYLNYRHCLHYGILVGVFHCIRSILSCNSHSSPRCPVTAARASFTTHTHVHVLHIFKLIVHLAAHQRFMYIQHCLPRSSSKIYVYTRNIAACFWHEYKNPYTTFSQVSEKYIPRVTLLPTGNLFCNSTK